jgi:hypothetical protein
MSTNSDNLTEKRYNDGMRPRHEVPAWAVTALSPVVRYSYSRHAYILRGIGSKRGPVLVVRRPEGPAASERDGRFTRDDARETAGLS